MPIWLGQAASLAVERPAAEVVDMVEQAGRGSPTCRRMSAAQLSRLTCEPPTIASLPSANRTQALLPPS